MMITATESAATPAASAAATETATPATPTRETAVDRHSGFLPSTDKHYMLTGELPADAKEGEEEKPAGEGDGEPGKTETEGDENAADSRESATDQKPQTQKTPQTSENRWQKLSRENRELKEKLARSEGREEGRQSVTPTATAVADPKAAAAKPAEPKIDDVDPKTGKAKYATLQDYLEARDTYRDEKLLEKVRAENAQTEQQRTAENNKRIIEAEVTKRVTAAKKAHSDYDDVIANAITVKNEHGQPALFWTEGSAIDGFFLDSDIGHEVIYHVAKNLDQHKDIFARDKSGKYLMNPVRQLRELAKIENQLASKSSKSSGAAGESGAAGSSGKTPSQANRPPHQTNGQGTVGKDAVAEAVEKQDQDTYMREQNARDLARRKRGK